MDPRVVDVLEFSSFECERKTCSFLNVIRGSLALRLTPDMAVKEIVDWQPGSGPEPILAYQAASMPHDGEQPVESAHPTGEPSRKAHFIPQLSFSATERSFEAREGRFSTHMFKAGEYFDRKVGLEIQSHAAPGAWQLQRVWKI